MAEVVSRCRYCGQAASRLLASAFVQALGGSSNIEPVRCYARKDSGDHDFIMATAPSRGGHWSSCATHNEPAYPAGDCDCGRNGLPAKLAAAS